MKSYQVSDKVIIKIGSDWWNGVVWDVTNSCKPFLVKYFNEEIDEWCTTYATYDELAYAGQDGEPWFM